MFLPSPETLPAATPSTTRPAHGPHAPRLRWLLPALALLLTTASAQINLSNGFTPGSVALNGSALLNGTRLQLTTINNLNQAGSAFAPTPVNVQAFTADFNFNCDNAGFGGEGFVFVLQNQSTSALGAPALALGYTGIPNSVGIKFDFGGGQNTTGLYTNGASPTTNSIILNASPNSAFLFYPGFVHIHMTYDGTTLVVRTQNSFYPYQATQSYPVNLPAILGSTTAYAGFTASTGIASATSSQQIVNWTFVSGPPVATPTLSPAGVYPGGTAPSYGSPLIVTLADATPGASIYYSYDGSANPPAPTTSSPLYTGPLSLTGYLTVRTVAVLNGVYSQENGAVYNITGTLPEVAAPTFSPASGAATSVTLADITNNTSIFYTVDGSTPNSQSTPYTAPVAIPLNSTINLKAIAYFQTVASPVTSATFTNSPPSITFPTGFSPGSVTLNGSATLNGAALQLTTTGLANQAASAFFPTPIAVQAFTTDFNFQITNPLSDGIMFVVQNQGPTALGAYGQFLGFGGTHNSVGVKFDIYDNAGEGPNSTGLYLNGAWAAIPAIDLTPSGVNLHSGNIFHAHIAYDGTTLIVTLTDTVTLATQTQSYPVLIPQIVGAQSAYVGFTAGTGARSATQDILSWTYIPGAPVATPTFTLPGAADYSSPATVSLADTTPGAIISYTLNGSVPTPGPPSLIYTGPFTLSASTLVRAIATLNGASSQEARLNYNFAHGGAFQGPVNDPTGFTTQSLLFNGSAHVNGTRLRLTEQIYEAGSAYAPTPVNIQSFTSDFNFQLTSPAADGFTFVIQNAGPNALGSYGIDLGYSNASTGIAGTIPIGPNSVAIKFDLFNNAGEGPNSTGLYLHGAQPTIPAINLINAAVALQLHSGDPFNVHITYDGTNLLVTLTDLLTQASATQTYTVNIPAVVQSSNAYVGFTAATGGLSAVQEILNWTFASGAPVPPPVFTPGTSATSTSFTLADTNSLADLYYTRDGTLPTINSTLYTGAPVIVTGNVTIRAIAVLNGVASQAVTATYTSTPTIDQSFGFSPGDVTLNGSATVSFDGPALALTTNSPNQAGSAFHPTPVNIQSFTSTFQLLFPSSNSGQAVADGLMFVIQNQSPNALGPSGQYLGFGGIKPSLGLKFDLYNDAGEGNNSTGIFLNGATPTVPATNLNPTGAINGISLREAFPIYVTLTYYNKVLRVTITNTTVTQSGGGPGTVYLTYNVDLPALLGANTAYLGFTASTGSGSLTSYSEIQSWTYSTP